MTTPTLEREQHTQIRLPSIVTNIIAGIMMVLAVWGSVSLLQWALDKRQASIVVEESSQITAAMRERQLVCLARNIYYEAGNEPFEGKVAVAQVTLNRAESGKFPDDICQVVYQKNKIYEKVICQFSWYCDRAAVVRPIHKDTYHESMEVAKKVLLEGFRLPSLQTAMYYHADYVDPKWGKVQIAKIGRHIFYK